MGAQRGAPNAMRLSDNRGGGWGSPGGRNENQQDKIIKGRLSVHRAGGGRAQGRGQRTRTLRGERQGVTCSERTCVHVGAGRRGIRGGLSPVWSVTLRNLNVILKAVESRQQLKQGSGMTPLGF